MATMSTVPKVVEQFGKTLDAHRTVHHHSLREARAARRARAAVSKAESPEAVQVPDLEPVGMPAGDTSFDPVAGL